MLIEKGVQKLNHKYVALVALFSILVVSFGAVNLVKTASARVSYFESCNALGTNIDEYPVGGDVWVHASGLAANTMYQIDVVNDVEDWTTGMLIPTPISSVQVTTDGNGAFLIKVWSEAQYGMYDIVADKNNDGTFQRASDALDDGDVGIGIEVNTAGILVTPEYALGGLAALGACFAGFIAFKKRNSLPKLHFN